MRRSAKVVVSALAAVAGGLLVVGAIAPSTQAATRGKSGLPPGPGNPIAAVYQMVQGLASQLSTLASAVAGLESRFGSPTTMWVNHLALTAEDAAATALAFSTGSPTGLSITTTSLLPVTETVDAGLQVPPGWQVKGVELCYTVGSLSGSSINITLTQLDTSALTEAAVPVTTTALTSTVPVCTDTPITTALDPTKGSIRLQLGLDFANVGDAFVIHAIGLDLVPSA